MRRLVLLAAIASLVACKGSDKKPTSGSAATKPAADEPPRISNHAFASASLSNVTSKAGPVDFAIALPIDVLKSPEVKDAYSTWEAKAAWFDTPTISVQFSEFPMSPDSTGDTEPLGDDAKDRVIARAEKLADGGYLNLDERKDKQFFRLEVCRPAHDGKLCCSVVQRSDKPLDAFDEIVGFAEKICKSMKAK